MSQTALSAETVRNAGMTMQYHLYEHPLYQGCGTGEELRVLLVGFSAIGEQFLDLCLEYAQNLEQDLRVDVTGLAASERDRYLEARPQLGSFFTLNDSSPVTDSYGTICFHCCDHPDLLTSEDIKAIVRKGGNPALQTPSYIMISLEEDEVSRRIAEELFSSAGETSVISYVRRAHPEPCGGNDDLSDRGQRKGPLPVDINRPVHSSALYSGLERMAFHAHLVWEQNLNLDFEQIRKEFEDPYYHDSSLCNVFSMKYKLHSVGIDLDSCGSEQAAVRFARILEDRSIRDRLIWREQRRWVTQLLCKGWTAQTDLEQCHQGQTRDQARKWHICLVRSRPDHLLQQFTEERGLEFWDCADEKELSELDELDRLSVRLHQMYLRHAETAKKKPLLRGAIIREIRNLINGSLPAATAFAEWYTCLQDLWNRDRSRFRLYKGLRNEFLSAVDTIEEETVRESVHSQVEAFELQFQPVMSSSEYCDYKKKNQDLIDNIPFILTYSCAAVMIIPISAADAAAEETGRESGPGLSDVQNSRAFSYLAAATVVNPARIIYLLDCSEIKPGNCGSIAGLIHGSLLYTHRKRLSSRIMMIAAGHFTDRTQKEVRKTLEEELHAVRNADIIYLDTDDAPSVPFAMLEYLCGMQEEETSAWQNGDPPYYAIEENNSALSAALRSLPRYRSFHRYAFDQRSMKFSSPDGFTAFSCILKTPYLRVSDMLSMNQYWNGTSFYPEFRTDYMDLWRRYRDNPAVWKDLCGRLKNHALETGELYRFGEGLKTPGGELIYYIPSGCYESTHILVNALVRYGIVGSDSSVGYCTTESCLVQIDILYEDDAEKFDRLFSDPYVLMHVEAVSVYRRSDHVVAFRFDDLRVREAYLGPGDDRPDRTDELLDLLEYFHRRHYITCPGFNRNTGTVSFTYATANIKRLLSVEGKILEIYVYHKLRESGCLDDIVSSYEIIWKNAGSEDAQKNELDCIATRGFTSFFIECKARPVIEEEYYDKLLTSVKKAGINAIAILVADVGRNQENNAGNQAAIAYGRSHNVITIYKPEEIDSIDTAIQAICSGIRSGCE